MFAFFEKLSEGCHKILWIGDRKMGASVVAPSFTGGYKVSRRRSALTNKLSLDMMLITLCHT